MVVLGLKYFGNLSCLIGIRNLGILRPASTPVSKVLKKDSTLFDSSPVIFWASTEPLNFNLNISAPLKMFLFW